MNEMNISTNLQSLSSLLKYSRDSKTPQSPPRATCLLAGISVTESANQFLQNVIILHTTSRDSIPSPNLHTLAPKRNTIVYTI